MRDITNFAGQNWLITPAALAVGEPPPTSIYNQKWLLVLSGVVIADLKGNSSDQWLQETLTFKPDMAGADDDPAPTSGPLNWAINNYGIQKPPGLNGVDYRIRFSLVEWAPFVALSSIFNEILSINSGFAVSTWRPNYFLGGTDAFSHLPVTDMFNGINVDVAVRDTNAWVNRLSYNITLLGKIVFIDVVF